MAKSDVKKKKGGRPPAKGRKPQDQPPGRQSQMEEKPRSEAADYRPAGRMKGKVVMITGADSGIGRATAVAFAKEGADVAVLYLDEHEDAREAKRLVEAQSVRCITISGDIGDSAFCRRAVQQTLKELGRLDVLINNAAEQHPQDRLEDITDEQLQRTFRTNIFGMFYLTREALPHLPEGSAIVNTTSVTAYQGNRQLLDYSSTKGAIVSFTRSLALSLVDRKIRVNAVAPGPIWTPLIPSTFEEEKTETFGQSAPMKRPGQPDEVAPCFVFLASDDASFITGQVLHPNGGSIVNG
ncbi:MAG: SDR family oxidoreductase [Planctomycetaceae bacterium]|nr:SDR family oxidoreductase [Planctomycetaceae bacterium]